MFAAIDIAPPAARLVPALVAEQWTAATPAPMAPRNIVVDPRIADGVAAMLAETPARADAANQQGDLQKAVYGSAATEQFARDFSAARVPSCGGADSLKFQPARIGPMGFGGLLAAPFLVVAAVRGKCLLR